MNILLLGPGKQEKNLRGRVFDPKVDTITVVDHNEEVVEWWKDRGATAYVRKLEYDIDAAFSYDLQDEIHAYELLNLLPNNFFPIWRAMWKSLKVGGTVTASVPHWRSEWIYAYPYPQKVYTVPLLMHLDQTAKLAAKEDFPVEWPRPYGFQIKEVSTISVPPANTPVGLWFEMTKVEQP